MSCRKAQGFLEAGQVDVSATTDAKKEKRGRAEALALARSVARVVSAVVDDARSALQLDRERYDVISSEPSNIWLAGVATLYTPEFYRIVRRRLADDGVFCQWVQLYQVPVPVVAGVVRNIRTVFPHVEVWFSSPGDVLIVGSLKPLTY